MRSRPIQERSLPRYYLHVCNGDGFTEDEEGRDFPDLDAARQMAIDGLRGILSEEMKAGQLNMASFIEIENEDHQLVITVPFAEVVRVSNEQEGRSP